MGRPIVSVVMTAFNAEPYVGQAATSILEQDFSAFEFIIVDDASTDRTAAIIDGLGDPRLRRVTNEVNLGVGASARRGMEMSEGRYVARMDADDWAHPARLRRQVAYMDAHPDCVALGCHYRLMDETGRIGRKVVIPCRDDVLKFRMGFAYPFCHPSVMYRADALKSADVLSNADDRYAEDYRVLTRLMGAGRFANLPDYLFAFRQHSGSLTSRDEAENRKAKRTAFRSYYEENYPQEFIESDHLEEILNVFVDETPLAGLQGAMRLALAVRHMATAYIGHRQLREPGLIYADAAEMFWRCIAKAGLPPQDLVHLVVSEQTEVARLISRAPAIVLQYLRR